MERMANDAQAQIRSEGASQRLVASTVTRLSLELSCACLSDWKAPFARTVFQTSELSYSVCRAASCKARIGCGKLFLIKNND